MHIQTHTDAQQERKRDERRKSSMKTISPFHTPFLAVILRFLRNSDCPPLPFHSLSYFMIAPLLSCPPYIFNTFHSSPLLSSSPLFSPLLYSLLLFPFQSILHLTSICLSYFLHLFLYHSHYLVALYRFSQTPYFSAVLALPSNSSMSTSSLTSLQQDR